MKSRVALIAVGLALEGIYAAIAARPAERDALCGAIVLQLAAGLLYLAAVGVLLRWDIPFAPRRGFTYGAILFFSVLFRATLVPATPSRSTDVWRYAWEGRVQANLENPYRLAPEAKELAPLRDSVWERVEHKEVPAVYGPLAEASFLVLRLPGAMKIFYALADLGVLGLVSLALKRRALPSSYVLLYGWHPLPIVEVAGEGHLDALGVLLLLLALERASGVLLGLAASVKFLPLVLLPAFTRRAGARAALVAAGVFAVSFLPYGLPRGLAPYATEWRFNATGLVAVEEALEWTGAEKRLALVLANGDPWLAVNTPYDKAPQRLVAALLVGLVAIALSGASLETAAFATIGAVTLLSPVVHPWYLLWLLPFAVWRRSLALLGLGLAIPIVYVVLLGYDGTRASWHEEAWPRVLLLVSFGALFIWENARHGKRLRGAP